MVNVDEMPAYVRQMMSPIAGPRLAPVDASAEPWDIHAKELPPRWCDECEVGQSIDRCWLCAGETVPTRRRRSMQSGAMRWQPPEAAE